MHLEKNLKKIFIDYFGNDRIIVKKQDKPDFGDYSVVLFPLVKSLKLTPEEIFNKVCEAVKELDIVKEVRLQGGFMNIFLDNRAYIEDMIKSVKSYVPNNDGERIVIDFSSPNIAKPFNIGLLRTTVIGNTLSNILEENGNTVIRVNHLGDWGTQFGKLLFAIDRWGDKEQIEQDPVNTLLELYVKYHKECDNHPEYDGIAREIFSGLEKGDRELRKKWEYLVDLSLGTFQKIYDRLNVRFDHYMGESFYEPYLEKTMERLQQRGLVTESEGALVVDVGEDVPPCILKKTDGSSLYALRDVTAALYRFEKMKADRLIYVVGNEQTLHFQQVFKVIERFDPAYSGRMEHISFGLYRFGDMKMSTRKGNVVFLEDVLDEAVRKSEKLMKDRGYDSEMLDRIAEMVGCGSVVFNDVSADRKKDIDFSYDRILDFNGETAPYLMYSIVRINSILEKSGEDSFKSDNIIPCEDYTALLKLLEDRPAVLKKSAEKRQPYILTNYLLELAGAFNKFYNNTKVLCDDRELMRSHLAFIVLVRDVLGHGLSLLGIQTPEKM